MESRWIGPGENPFSERNSANAEAYKRLHDAGKARLREREQAMREQGIPVKEPRSTQDSRGKRDVIFVHGTDHLGRRRR